MKYLIPFLFLLAACQPSQQQEAQHFISAPAAELQPGFDLTLKRTHTGPNAGTIEAYMIANRRIPLRVLRGTWLSGAIWFRMPVVPGTVHYSAETGLVTAPSPYLTSFKVLSRNTPFMPEWDGGVLNVQDYSDPVYLNGGMPDSVDHCVFGFRMGMGAAGVSYAKGTRLRLFSFRVPAKMVDSVQIITGARPSVVLKALGSSQEPYLSFSEGGGEVVNEIIVK